MDNPLVFIDTNVLLDFYRSRNESGLTLLKRIDGLHDQLITSYQVEMEFKKNRQAAIQESLNNLKAPVKIQPAAFLHETKLLASFNRNFDGANTRIKRVRKRLIDVLAKPTTRDPVYRIVQRLFNDETDNNLSRSKPIRYAIRRMAWKRFILGYPPRKDRDSSTGDSVNWEWIIHCAIANKSDVVIVSRDTDYGITLDGNSFINDWLSQEFKKRVSKKKNVMLVDRLSAAFKLLSVSVTSEEEKDEDDLISLRRSKPTAESAIDNTDSELRKLINEIFDRLNLPRDEDEPSPPATPSGGS